MPCYQVFWFVGFNPIKRHFNNPTTRKHLFCVLQFERRDQRATFRADCPLPCESGNKARLSGLVACLYLLSHLTAPNSRVLSMLNIPSVIEVSLVYMSCIQLLTFCFQPSFNTRCPDIHVLPFSFLLTPLPFHSGSFVFV